MAEEKTKTTETANEKGNFSAKDEVILSPFQQIRIKFKCNRLAMFGFYLFIFIVAVVIITHFYTKAIGYDFAATNAEIKNSPPSWEYPFGTDKYGRNAFVRVLEGGWISLQVGALATVMAIVIGLLMGSIAGFFAGKVDYFIMRLIEIVQSFPFLALAYTIAAIFRDKPAETKLYVIVFILGILSWTGLARMVRGQILGLREQEFIVATRALGIKRRHQITRHLIPNVLSTVVVAATLQFAGAIMSESFLSFLNLSVTEPIPTWGALLSKAAKNSTSLRLYWWIWVFPGAMLFSFIMSINLVGEGLRDAIDPKAQYITRAQRKAARKRRKEEKRLEREEKKQAKLAGKGAV